MAKQSLRFAVNDSGGNVGAKTISPTSDKQECEKTQHEPSSAVRRRGGIIFVLGSATAAVFATILWNFFTGPGTIFIPLSFAAVAAIGLLELVSGISFDRIVRSWNEFKQTRAARIAVYIIFSGSLLAYVAVMHSIPK